MDYSILVPKDQVGRAQDALTRSFIDFDNIPVLEPDGKSDFVKLEFVDVTRDEFERVVMMVKKLGVDAFMVDSQLQDDAPLFENAERGIIAKFKEGGNKVLSKIKNMLKDRITKYEESTSLDDMISNMGKMDPTSRRILNNLFFTNLNFKGIMNQGDVELFDRKFQEGDGFETEKEHIKTMDDLVKFVEAVSKMENSEGYEAEYIAGFFKGDVNEEINLRLQVQAIKDFLDR